MTAIAGQTHDLVIAGDGYMLAQSGKGTTHYKKALDGPASIGLTPGNSSSFENLQGPLNAPKQPFRRAIWSRWSGLGQGMVAGADGWQQAQNSGKVNDLVNLRPVQNGGALALVPQVVSGIVTAAAPTTANYFSVSLGAVQVLTIGPKIYVSANPGTNGTGFSLLNTSAGDHTGMAIWNNQVMVSNAGALFTFNTSTGAFTAFTPAQASTLFMAYQGVLVAANGAQLFFLINGAWVGGPVLDNAITALEELNGALYVGTHTVLYRLQGQLKPKAPTTAPNTLDYFDFGISVVWRTNYYSGTPFWCESNFAKMSSWRGYLWFMAGGKLYRAAPVSGQETLQPEVQPVFGNSLGMAVCGNFLVVITRYTGSTSTVWVNDGNFDMGAGLGWFKIAANAGWAFPCGNAGYSQGVINALQYTNGSNTTLGRWLFDPVSPIGYRADNYGVSRTAVSGKVTMPLVTPEDLGQLAGATNGKVLAVNLRRVGLEWSVIDAGVWWSGLPISGATLAAMNIVVEVTYNAGLSWITLVEPTVGALSLNTWWFTGNRIELPLTSDFYNGPVMYPAAPPSGAGPVFFPAPDMGWLVRITWGGLEMPLLRRVWLDYDVAEVAVGTGRTWQFDVNLADPQIGLGGAVEVSPNDGLSKAGRLWGLVTGGASTTFSDLDGVSYRVKVVGFEQRRVAQGALPGLPPEWNGTVKLAEAWPGN